MSRRVIALADDGDWAVTEDDRVIATARTLDEALAAAVTVTFVAGPAPGAWQAKVADRDGGRGAGR